ncbi:HisA/HisF-related TIM barrel protein [Bacillus licheniformis]
MSEFTVYPAIDMRNGKCVRLIQGDYEKETIYGHSPLEMASLFAEAGQTGFILSIWTGQGKAKSERQPRHKHCS